jgi:hypothetical protein
VVVGVDQPGRHEAATRVDRPDGVRPLIARRPDAADQTVGDRHPPARDLAAVEQQTAAAAEIDRNIGVAAEGSRDIAAGAEAVAGSTESSAGRIEESRGIADQLAGMAADLQGRVAQFTV